MPRHRLEQVEGSKSVHAFGVFQGGSFSLKGEKKKNYSLCLSLGSQTHFLPGPRSCESELMQR